MYRRYGLLIALSAIVVTATVHAKWTSFLPYPQLPFTVRWVDEGHALIEPIAGVTPTRLRAGDRLDLAAQSRATRIALAGSELVFLPASARYPLVLERGAGRVRVTVHAVNGNSGGLANRGDWTRFCSVTLYAAMALLALICLIGFSQATQIGLYVMAESIAGSSIRPGARAMARTFRAHLRGRGRVHQSPLIGGVSLLGAEVATTFVFFIPAWNAFAAGIAHGWLHVAGMP